MFRRPVDGQIRPAGVCVASGRGRPALAARWTAMAWVSVACVGLGFGAPPEIDDLSPDRAIERYIGERGLLEPLAAHLRQRLSETTGEERQRVADRLGKVYVSLMDEATTSARRREVEELGRDLLASVPDADAFDLRLNLARAMYLSAEETAERVRLRLAGPEEKLEAERVLREVAPQFRTVSQSLEKRVEALDRKSKSAAGDEKVRTELQESRRLRSLGTFYAGWSQYYLAMLTGDVALAGDAAESFGVLLNAPSGRAAAVDKAPRSLFRYEHVARAAIGSALCASLRGNDIEALRWMDALAAEEGLHPAVRGHLFSRQLVILSASQRWSDIDLLARRRRVNPPELGGGALSAAEARLLAVLSLEFARNADPGARNVEVVRNLAQGAVSDLVAMGELGHVVDLVRTFGTAPIGGDGFAVRYVMGMQGYDQARAEHEATGAPADMPTSEASISNRYREASGALTAAAAAPDAARFAAERERASLTAGLALYYAGDLEPASEAFRRLSVTSGDVRVREDASWYAIVALDRAIETGRPSLIPERDRLALLFLRDHPKTERAVRLLLRRSGRELISDAEAAEVLLAVLPDSPVYDVARLEASGLLYKLFLRASPGDRAAAGKRMISVGEESLESQIRQLSTATGESQNRAWASVSRLSRQIAHAALTIPAPDPAAAEAALDRFEQAAGAYGLDLSNFRDEIAFRRLQSSVLAGDESKVRTWLEFLRGRTGPYAEAAERLVFGKLLTAWRADRANLVAAAAVVESGTRLSDSLAKSASTSAAAAPIASETADAAATIWLATKDRAMRDLALRLDRRAWDRGVRTAAMVRRLGATAEDAGDAALAAECWRFLSASLPESTSAWYEARYNAIRLTAALDAPTARAALRQFIVLHPNLGGESWSAKFEELASMLDVSTDPNAADEAAGGDGSGSSSPSSNPADGPATSGGGR